MSCHDLRKGRVTAAWVVAIAAIGLTAAASAQSMVIRSTGPSAAKFPTGKKFKLAESIALVAGDKVVVMEGGVTRTLTGPGQRRTSGSVQASQTMSATVTRMIAKEGAMRSKGGFTRGPGEAAPSVEKMRAPNLWVIDIRDSGPFCVADPAKLLFWRPDMTTDALLRIEAKGDAAKAETLAFVSGANYRRWPGDTMPVQFGADYRISGAGLAAPVAISFTQLGALPETAEGTVDLLLAKGCTAQLNRLVETLTESAAG